MWLPPLRRRGATHYIIAETLADAIAAQEGGATQLDLESAFLQGGLTPSMGLIPRKVRVVILDQVDKALVRNGVVGKKRW
ncbi:MAG: hypothetical protein AMJ93_06790 [Anaerolineae bacterium SM23_84]|nr:MAG: hypothetical protein AMJ93_06790 [Anaerolineae bacterium SM23_84]